MSDYFWLGADARDAPAAHVEIDAMRTEPSRVRLLPDGRMKREDAARYLGVKVKTMAMWKLNGKGPACRKVGGGAFYFKDDLDAFIRGDAV